MFQALYLDIQQPHLILMTTITGSYFYLCFADEETETQK